ncbi:MAG: hypothetical protein IJI22_01760 [Bacilli bacterium]|nr:hypothetical protein [Bacilli bacterium]
MSRYTWGMYGERSVFKYADCIKGVRYTVFDWATHKTYEFPEVIIKGDKEIFLIPQKLQNADFFEWLCETSPDGWRIVPQEFKKEKSSNEPVDNIGNDDLIKQHYSKASLAKKKELIRNGHMRGLLKTEDLKELINYHMLLDRKRVDYDFWENISKDIVDEKTAKKMFSCNSEYIRYIPEEYLTDEMVKTALTEGKKIIGTLPQVFLTKENIELALINDPKEVFKLPEEIRNKYLSFAVSLRGQLLANIPREQKTAELCRLAFSNNCLSFRYIPHEFKTIDMCIRALAINPRLIKYVPITFLNEEFLNTLEDLEINIDEKDKFYVKEALRINETLDIPTTEENDIDSYNVNVPPEIANIYIRDLYEFFSSNAQTMLEKAGIHKLGELLNLSERSDFARYFSDKKAFGEVLGTVKILRCKFLGEDPLIDINSEELEPLELYQKLGFSTRVINALRRTLYCTNAKTFFERITSSDIESKLKGIRNLGSGGAKEVIIKTNIVIDYYKNKDNVKTDDDTQKEIQELNEELQELIAMRNRYDQLIKGTIEKIQEKLVNNSRGGNTK